MALPRMPELVLNYAPPENYEDDIAEESQLLIIVKKLQTAKQSLEQSKKRSSRRKRHLFWFLDILRAKYLINLFLGSGQRKSLLLSILQL